MIPTPWIAKRFYDAHGWGHEVLCAHGKRHDAYEVTRDEGARLACTMAVAPEALASVMAAAAKGGAEANMIKARYERVLAEIDKPLTPEARAA